MKLQDVRAVDVDVVPTGSPSLDLALGVGGMPRGRVIEIFGPESSGKCVKSDTVIFSELGLVPISVFGNQNIPEFQKKEIFIYSEQSYEKTSHFYNGGVKPTIKIKTNYGYELEGTLNHRIRVLDKEGNYLFRRLDELEPTDYVAIQRGQNCFGKGVDLSDFEERIWAKMKLKKNTSKKNFKKFEITSEIAKLMGYLVGDGTCTATGLNKNNIQITTADKETERDLKTLCLKIFDEEPKITRDKRSHARRVMIHNVKARAFLHYAGLGWHDASQKEIPWSIMCSPKEITSAFLKTLFECDGSVSEIRGIEYCSKSEKLVKQLQIILLNFGIIGRIKSRKIKNYPLPYYYFYISGQQDRKIFLREIGFITKGKQEKLVGSIKRIRMFNTNRDVIPNINQKLKEFLEAYRTGLRDTNRADWEIFYDYLPGTPKFSLLSYDRLRRLLERFSDGRNIPEYQELENLYNLGFFWDKVVEKRDAIASVLDFTIPSNATFCGNGFINHNTTLALHVCAEAQKAGGVAAFIDAEHALDPDYAKRLGVNTDELLISQPDSGEQALQIVETLVRSGEVDVIVIDSVAALAPKAAIEGEMGEFQIGLQARLMSSALQKLSGVISKTKTIVIFLNQIRMKIGIMFGNPETTSGGLALKFYASVRLDLRRIAQIKHGDEIIGSRIRAKVVKNKVAAPFRIAEFDIYYNEGISYITDLLNLGIKQEVVKKSGSWLDFGQTRLGQGIEAAKQYLKANPKVAEEIKKAVFEKPLV
jgi:recombination protein RecA